MGNRNALTRLKTLTLPKPSFLARAYHVSNRFRQFGYLLSHFWAEWGPLPVNREQDALGGIQ
jgi:hypothetical protein